MPPSRGVGEEFEEAEAKQDHHQAPQNNGQQNSNFQYNNNNNVVVEKLFPEVSKNDYLAFFKQQ